MPCQVGTGRAASRGDQQPGDRVAADDDREIVGGEAGDGFRGASL
jgi:hypothetical protein